MRRLGVSQSCHITRGVATAPALSQTNHRPPRLPRPRRAASPMSPLLFIPLRVLTESLALPPPTHLTVHLQSASYYVKHLPTPPPVFLLALLFIKAIIN